MTTFNSKTTRDWIWTKRELKVGDDIKVIQALSCTLPTKVNKRRGNHHKNLQRCKCKKSVEDDVHILNSYELKSNLVTLRHNNLVGKVAEELKRSHNTANIWMEQKDWSKNLQLVKPDITLIKDEHCLVIIVLCPYEVSIKHLNQRGRDKVLRYKPRLNVLTQVDWHSNEIISLVVGSFGNNNRQ